jgi:Protein of unknown function (DUF3467)
MEKEEMLELGLRNVNEQKSEKSDHFTKIYANNVVMSLSLWDMSLTFGEIIGTTLEEQPIVEQKVKVNMSKEFTKALANLLSSNVASYERQYGEIKLINAEAESLGESVEVKPEESKRSKNR